MFISRENLQSIWKSISRAEQSIFDLTTKVAYLEMDAYGPRKWATPLQELRNDAITWRDNLASRIEQALGESSKALARIEIRDNVIVQHTKRLIALERASDSQGRQMNELHLRVRELENANPMPKSQPGPIGRDASYIPHLEAMIKEQRQVSQKLRDKLALNRQERVELKEANTQLSITLQDKLEGIKNLHDCNNRHRDTILSKNREIQNLQAQLEELEQSRDSWRRDWQVAKNGLEGAMNCNDTQAHTIANLNNQIVELKDELWASSIMVQERDKEIAKLKGEGIKQSPPIPSTDPDGEPWL